MFPMGVATTYKRPLSSTFVVVFMVGLLTLTCGCQSTSPQNPTSNSSDDKNLPAQSVRWDSARDKDDSALELDALTNATFDFYERNQFADAQLLLQQRINNSHAASAEMREFLFEHAYLRTLQTFIDDPASGLKMQNSLSPQSYEEKKSKVLLAYHMHRVLGDCIRAVDNLAAFEASGLEEQQELGNKIWNVLTTTCIYGTDSSYDSSNLETGPWLVLANILKNTLTPTERSRRFREWKIANPHHFAAVYPPDQFEAQQSETRKIALLLPQTGPLSSAARAIRDGFISAYLSEPSSAESKEIRVFDTENYDILPLIDSVMNYQPDVIVGPLDKNRVAEVVEGDPLPVPIVTLNRVHTPVRNGTSLQLALVVEDDATHIASKLSALRAKRIVLVLGGQPWSTRAATQFTQELSPQIDIVGEAVLTDLTEITTRVGEVLHVSLSQARHETLQEVIRNDIEFVTRGRKDINAIVAFVDPREYASLTAALQYHFAGDIQLFVAEPSLRNHVITNDYGEGTLFTSTPAMLYGSPLVDAIKKEFKDSPLFPLYVFGSDAYRVAMNVRKLNGGKTLYGNTGILQKQSDGVVSRKPVWGLVELQQRSVPTVLFPIKSDQSLL